MIISCRLTKIFPVLLILIFATFLTVKAQPSIYTLPVGTKFRVKMDNEINSKFSSVNDTFTVTLREPIIVSNTEMVSVGSVIEGRIIRVKSASLGNTNGRLEIKFQTLRLPNEVIRSIDASLVDQKLFDPQSSSFPAISILGGTGAGTILGAIIGKGKGAMIGAGIGAGAGATATFLKKGKEARIKANQEFEIRLNKEVTLPVRDF